MKMQIVKGRVPMLIALAIAATTLAACARTPQPVVDKIYKDTLKALDDTHLKARLHVAGMAPVGNTPKQFASAIVAESKLWAEVVKNRGLKAN